VRVQHLHRGLLEHIHVANQGKTGKAKDVCNYILNIMISKAVVYSKFNDRSIIKLSNLMSEHYLGVILKVSRRHFFPINFFLQ
jgi:hypothetical protein